MSSLHCVGHISAIHHAEHCKIEWESAVNGLELTSQYQCPKQSLVYFSNVVLDTAIAKNMMI